MVKAICDFCGKEFEKKRKLRARNFCCKDHLNAWQSEYNRTANPVNKKSYWTAEKRANLRQCNLGKGENRAYKKIYRTSCNYRQPCK